MEVEGWIQTEDSHFDSPGSIGSSSSSSLKPHLRPYTTKHAAADSARARSQRMLILPSLPCPTNLDLLPSLSPPLSNPGPTNLDLLSSPSPPPSQPSPTNVDLLPSPSASLPPFPCSLEASGPTARSAPRPAACCCSVASQRRFARG
eukprot:29124-Chlamydomonas_euryale.AAC.4